MSDEITICKKCKHRVYMYDSYNGCSKHLNGREIDYVTGKIIYYVNDSKIVRTPYKYKNCKILNNGDCEHFEKKINIFKKIYSWILKNGI